MLPKQVSTAQQGLESIAILIATGCEHWQCSPPPPSSGNSSPLHRHVKCTPFTAFTDPFLQTWHDLEISTRDTLPIQFILFGHYNIPADYNDSSATHILTFVGNDSIEKKVDAV